MKKSNLIGTAALLACLMGAAEVKASIVIPSTSVTWAGQTDPTTTVGVNFNVTDNSGIYTYSYTVTDNAPADKPLTSFEVDLFAGAAASITVPTAPAGYAYYDNGTTVTWSSTGVTPLVAGGGGSATLTFTSTLAPGYDSGSAIDDGPGPWGPAGKPALFVPSPVVVPEPTTLIAGALLVLPFGASTLRGLRKNRAA